MTSLQPGQIAATLVLLVCMCATPLLARRVLLRPVFAAGRRRRSIARFTVTDLAALTAYFAIAVGLTSLVTDLLDEFLANYISLVALVYVGGTWYLGVQSLDAADIIEPRRRLVYLSISVPFAYAGSMTLVVLTASIVWMLAPKRPRIADPASLLDEHRWILWSVYFLLWLGLVLSWQAAQWVARGPSPGKKETNASA